MDRSCAGLVDAWMEVEEGISDVEEGLGQAGRFAPETRHYRGVLAMSSLTSSRGTGGRAAGTPAAIR